MRVSTDHNLVLLIVRDNVTRQCPQTTTLAQRGEPKRIRTEFLVLTSLTPCLTTWPSRLTLLVVTTPGRANLSPASKHCPHHGTIQVGKTHGRSVFITWTCTSLSKGGLFSSNWTCKALYKEGLLVLLGPARHYTKIRFYYLDMHVIIQGRSVLLLGPARHMHSPGLDS